MHLKHTNDDMETKTLEFDFGKHGGLQVGRTRCLAGGCMISQWH